MNSKLSKNEVSESLDSVGSSSPLYLVVCTVKNMISDDSGYLVSDYGNVALSELLTIYRRRKKHMEKTGQIIEGFDETLDAFEKADAEELISFYIKWQDQSTVGLWMDQNLKLIGCII